LALFATKQGSTNSTGDRRPGPLVPSSQVNQKQRVKFIKMLAAEVTTSNNAPTTTTVEGPFVDLKTLDSTVKVPISQIKIAPGICVYIDGELAKKNLKQVADLEPSDDTLLEVKVPHVTSYILSVVLSFLKNHPDTASYDAETYKVNAKLDKSILALPNEDLPQVLLAADLFDLPELSHIVGEAIATRVNEAEGKRESESLFRR